MPRYDINMFNYMKVFEGEELIERTFDVAQQILKCLEIVHNAGFVFNDLKATNIMISLNDAHEITVTLIDFGFLTKYRDKDDNHV